MTIYSLDILLSQFWVLSKKFLFFKILCWNSPLFPGSSYGKAFACNAGDLSSIPWLERSPGEGNGNPFQYPCLENPMNGGAWQATVNGDAKSQTWLSDFTFFPFFSPHPLQHLLFVDSYTIFLFIHSSINGHGVPSTFWLLWIMLLRIWAYK